MALIVFKIIISLDQLKFIHQVLSLNLNCVNLSAKHVNKLTYTIIY